VLVALRGSTALSLAKDFKPGAITLDIALPDMAGWTILDQLKHDPATRHIPVHIISGDENRRRGLALGAMTYLEKSLTKDSLAEAFETIHHSVERRVKTLLMVVPQEDRQKQLTELLEGPDIEIRSVPTGAEAMEIIKQNNLDCIVLDAEIRDVRFTHVLDEIHKQAKPHPVPTIVYGTGNLSYEEELELKAATRVGVVKYAQTGERLLDETALLMHRVESALSEIQRQMLQRVRAVDSTLAGKKALVVDDDLRNIFALTSILEHHDLNVIHAENGRAGIDLLKKTPDVDIVLMDIMMPEMDGYETMRAIRQIPQFRSLPIIALTAKAMKGDRDKCIEAGASDYVTKPVDLEQLFSVLRVWVARGHEHAQMAVKESAS
jgi:CheY-like chemotaxis protein